MAKPDLHAFWQQTLSDWQASDLSGAAFCKQQSLSYHRFAYWRLKLSGDADNKGTFLAASGFARVAPVQKAGVTEGLTVSLPGISITGLHAGNIELLGPLLRQL